MEDLGESLGYVRAYVSQEVESVKLEVAEKVSIASSTFITGLVLTSLGSFVLIFGAIAAALFLGQLLESAVLGFFLVSAFFLVVLLLIFIFRKQLITDRVVTAVIHLIFNKKYHD